MYRRVRASARNILNVLALQHNNAGAQAAFDKAVSADPRNITALSSRAEFLVSTQKLAEANRELQKLCTAERAKRRTMAMAESEAP